MAEFTVTSYSPSWYLGQHRGYIQIQTQGGPMVGLEGFQGPEEFMVVVDLLRNEKPVLWDDVNRRLRTALEPVGEAEV